MYHDSVGKTQLMNQCALKKFREAYYVTIGADFLTKEITVDDSKTTLQIWDTAGLDRFETLGPVFYRSADACVLVFDVNNAKSFDNIEAWHAGFMEVANPRNPTNYPIILVGNKADKEGTREVSRERIEEWCQKHDDMPYFETSAKTGANVDEAFLSLFTNCKFFNDNPNEEETQPETKDGCIIS